MCLCGCDSSPPPSVPPASVPPAKIPQTNKSESDLATVTQDRGTPQSIEAATALVNAARFGDAEPILRHLLLQSPDDPPALFLMARCKAAMGDLPGAVSMLEQIPPTHPEAGLPALGMAADWLMELGHFTEAERKLRAILNHQDRFVIAHRRLAQLLNSQGRRAEAIPHMRALARFQVATPSELYGMNSFTDPFIHSDSLGAVELPLSDLCLAKLEWFEGHLQESKAMVLELLGKPSPSAAEAAFAGRILALLQDDDAFVSWIGQLPLGIEQEPEYWFAVGDWYQRRGQHDIAVRCFAEAVQLDDTDRFSFRAMARSLDALGRSDLSKSANDRAELLEEVNYIITGIERTPLQMQRLVTVLAELGRTGEARRWLQLSSESVDESGLLANLPEPNERASNWSTCGVDTEDWPLPDFASIQRSAPVPPIHRAPVETLVAIEDIAHEVGLDFQYQPGGDVEQLRMFQITGAGVAATDFDRDGWPDLYFGQGGGDDLGGADSLPNQLFRNMGGDHFTNVTLPSDAGSIGYAQGVAAGDFNQDGFMDLVVANIGPNFLLRNNGDGTFSRQPLGESDPGTWTASVACGDLDGDAVPEIVLVNYINDPGIHDMTCSGLEGTSCSPQQFQPAVSEILRCDDDGKWQPWTPFANACHPTYGLGVLITNIDEEAGNDLYIANDTEPNSLWLSRFSTNVEQPYLLTESAQLNGCAVGLRGNAEGSMGIASADFDRNGRLDLHVTNFATEPSALYLQHDHGIFRNQYLNQGLDLATYSNVGWGTQACDVDNDGWTDVAMMNGHLYPSLPGGSAYRMRAQLFRGGPAGFQSWQPPPGSFWDTPRLGRALAKIDWNRDGREDLVSVHLDTPAALLQNNTTGGNWLQLNLVATASERNAIGAKARAMTADGVWTQWMTSGDGYQCSNESLLNFGIGDAVNIVELLIHWPSGTTSSYTDLPVNRRYLAIENEPELFVENKTQPPRQTSQE